MKLILKYMFKYKFSMLWGFIVKVIGTVMDLAIPYLLSYILDEIVPTGNMNEIVRFGLIMLGCTAVGFIGTVIANQNAARVASKVTTDFRHDLFSKIESLSSRQTDEVTLPSLISRMSSDTWNVHTFTGMIQRLGVRAPILLVGGLIVTFSIDVKLTLVLLAVLPLVVLITTVITMKGIPLFSRVQTAIDDYIRIIRENITGIRVIKALSKEKYENERYEKVSKKLIDYELKSQKTMIKSSPINNLLLNLGMVGVIIFGAFRVNSGLCKTGIIIAFTNYVSIILNALLSVTRVFIMTSRAAASSNRIKVILDMEPDLEVVDDTNTSSSHFIEFRNVTFSYNKKENNITNLSFTLEKGESLGIIGATGSGKSTIISLLLRFYDVDSGDIFVNGKNIKEYNKQELRQMFGTVFQNDTIFSTTIKENIDFNRNISDEEIIEASNNALSMEYINSLEEKFDTELSERGMNLSGGQRQRLLISRALANKPEILVLDDSSSALDYKTDSLLRKNLKENYKDTTLIIIAQRISSINNCDKIIVIDDGVAIGYGKHNELINSNEVYNEIFQSQMGGGLCE